MSRLPSKFTVPTGLSVVLAADALLFLGFGLASWFSPHATFGSIVDLGGARHDALLLAALSTLSIFYTLLGAVALIAVVTPVPSRFYFAVPMFIGHIWIGAKGVKEMGREGLIGNPWPDTAIHGTFVVLYSSLFLARCLRRTPGV